MLSSKVSFIPILFADNSSLLSANTYIAAVSFIAFFYLFHIIFSKQITVLGDKNVKHNLSRKKIKYICNLSIQRKSFLIIWCISFKNFFSYTYINIFPYILREKMSARQHLSNTYYYVSNEPY